ncbi:MAG: glutamine--tRNA ligase/YqeY domain fusion protein [Phycisphaerales bacterium]
MPEATPPHAASSPRHFIHEIVDADIASGRWGLGGAARDSGTVIHTRFPPEPNGYLHVGHAKSICLNYGLAKQYGGKFNLRFDDTNPAKEEQEYVDAIKADVKWLGAHFDTGPHAGGLFFASDYFAQMYALAVELINKGRAYVCELSGEDVSARRGNPGTPATSPFRDRPAAESVRLFAEMKEGKHPDGSMTLRAKIDLASPNFNLRDPVLYRVLHEAHHNTGTDWCIYPMYDWAHGIEDSLEGITHSICTLEFENHRPLYDWLIDAINEGRTDDGSGPWGKKIHHSQQIEFAKLRPTYTVLSKRNLLKMVQEGIVKGWDDPRMPTLSGLRRRGYPAAALWALCEDVGVTKVESFIDVSRLENACRDVLNKTAARTMAVLRPLKVVIENWPRGADGKPEVDLVDFVVNPEDAAAGTIMVPFTGELFIEEEDFALSPPPGFFRLSPGAEVRLRWGYFITCTGAEKDATGRITAVRCTYDPATRGGDSPHGPDGKPTKKVKATLHWISALPGQSVDADVRLFDRLFTAEEPGSRTGNYADDLNPKSLEVVRARVDPAIAANAKPGDVFQFERLGYFCVDADSTGVGTAAARLVFNRTVGLKDSRVDAGKPKAGPRVYTFAEAAADMKMKAERLPEAAARFGLVDVATRVPAVLTLDEVRGMKEWLKKNPLPKV